jgi:hypothetical protein
MTVRPATFGDIPGIVAVILEGHNRSHYRDSSCSVDVAEAKRFLVNAIQRHGSHKLGATWVAVSETDGRITGFIVGTLARISVFGDKLFASDLFWFATEDVSPTDPVRLMKGMVEWARAAPDCIEVKCGTQAVVGDPKKAGRILEHLGMQHYGEIYRMEITR